MSMGPMSRNDALEDISTWSCADVVALLQKNGVEEACWKAAEKRQIDGDELLHLTEGKLALWKSDLTRPLIWNLWTFVEELKNCPEKYVEQRQQQQQEPTVTQQEQQQQQQSAAIENGALSDASSWDTDFDNEEDEQSDKQEQQPPPPPQRCNGTTTTTTMPQIVSSDNFRNSLRMFEENARASMLLRQADGLRGSNFSLNRPEKPNGAPPTLETTYVNNNNNNNNSSSNAPPSPESTYANCQDNSLLQQLQETENTYMNTHEATIQQQQQQQQGPHRNASRLHHNGDTSNSSAISEQQKSLAEKLREQLVLLGVKPKLAPKPEAIGVKGKDEVILRAGGGGGSDPRISFLHQPAKVNGNAAAAAAAAVGDSGLQNGLQKKSDQNPTTNNNNNNNNNSNSNSSSSSIPESSSEESLRNLPRPPTSIQSFDLVANLPTATMPLRRSISDDEESYESFDQRIVDQHNNRRPDSAQSASAGHGSVDSVYRPPSLSACADDDESVYELYESITESPDDDRPTRKEPHASPPKVPPPLPAKPPRISGQLASGLGRRLADELADMMVWIKRAIARSCYPPEPPERSPNSRSATLPSRSSLSPSSSSNSSPSSATRPLPPPPERQSYYERPWFHNLTREQANRLIEERKADGYFLLRPSVSNPDNPMTLVLWYRDKVYNIPVRRRPDNRYALGTPKSQEQSFESIDDIVPHFKSEALVLSSGGIETGRTKLTDTPSKQQ